LPEADYLEWMKLCKKHGLVPKAAKCYRDGECNIMEIVRPGQYDRHITYAALCCYRWSESKAPMIYQVTAYSREHPTAVFWQAFHYFLSRAGITNGHSFANMGYSSYVGITQIQRTDLAKSLCLCKFFEKQRIADRKKVTNATSAQLDEIAKSIRGMEVKKLEDILDDRWAVLYQMKKLTRKPLHAKFAEIAK